MNLKNYKYSLVAVAVITLISGTIYIFLQQGYRKAADFPQTQLIKQAVQALDAGNDPKYLIINDNVDLNKSTEPFVIIYDKDAVIVASAAILDGKHPVPPKGVFDYVAKNGQNRLTWAPKAGVRIAAVVDKYNNGYVLVGRSLKEAEDKISRLNKVIGLSWLVAMVLIAVVNLFLNKRRT